MGLEKNKLNGHKELVFLYLGGDNADLKANEGIENITFLAYFKDDKDEDDKMTMEMGIPKNNVPLTEENHTPIPYHWKGTNTFGVDFDQLKKLYDLALEKGSRT
jgi:hypothetical protein